MTLVLKQIERAAGDEAFDVIAHCFMPDHVHLLVAGAEEPSNLRRFVARAKQFSGYHFARAHGRQLWQRYGYERVLRNDEASRSVTRYILENPLRKALVHDPYDYAFLGSLLCPREELFEWIGFDG